MCRGDFNAHTPYTWVERSAATVPGIEGSPFLSEFPRVACVQYDRLLGQARA